MNKCTLCYEGAYKDKLVLFSARRDDRLIVVEDVPALVCNTCGDQIFTEKAARGIERAAAGEPAYSSPVYRFSEETA
jgi:YgiT-type zinc finger domain-containing protein